jgi:DNA-binding MarR family transcriptional regulator
VKPDRGRSTVAEETTVDGVAESLWELWRLWRRESHPTRHGTVTPEQYYVLRHLARKGPQTVTALARWLQVTPATVTMGTRRLEEAGLVHRQRSADDQRVVTVGVTEAARELLDAWQNERRRALIARLERLDPAERIELGRLLARMIRDP